jgi:hypothetical protein
MRNSLRLLAVTALAAVGIALGLPAGTASADPARAAAPSAAAAPAAGGYDISHPQCGTTLPTGQAWGVVGVNGGLATTGNPCLISQLSWAAQFSGAVPGQPPVQVYLNTANPGEVRSQVTTWPTTGATPYGACAGGNTTACSWEYGYERAQYSVTSFFVPSAAAARIDVSPASYVWWLDVETSNTWQWGSSAALGRNRASLEGMTAYLTATGAQVGLYSTATQWKSIAGTVGTGSTLRTLDSWLAGASTSTGARSNCAKAPLVAGGDVTMTQFVSGGLDRDVSCR